MKNYITAVLQRFKHKNPSKPTYSPHPHNKPTYGVKPQCAPEPDTSHPLSLEETTNMKAITGCLLHYACAVDNKSIVALSSIATQTHSPTQKTLELITHLLNYVATYQNDGTIYRKRQM